MNTFEKTALCVIISAALVASGCGESDDKEKEDEKQSSNLVVIPSTVSVIPTMSVTVDGAESEWSGVAPVIIDPNGDGGTFGGLDVTSMSLSQDSESLYVKVNLKSADRPTGEYYNYWLYFENNDFSFAIEAFHDPKPYIRLWNITGANRDYNKQTVLVPNLTASTSGSIMEFKVPKNLISTSQKYRVDFFTHHTQGLVWKNDNGDKANSYGYFSFF